MKNNNLPTGILLQFHVDEQKKDVAIMPKALLGNNEAINTLLSFGAEFLNTRKGQALCEDLIGQIISYATSRSRG